MDYLLTAYGATLLILGLAAWQLRRSLARAEDDVAALGAKGGGAWNSAPDGAGDDGRREPRS